MPTWNEILQEIGTQTTPFDSIRRKYLKELSDYTGRNTIIYYSGWLQKAQLQQQGYRFDINDSDKMGLMSTVNGLDRSKGLDLILHTPGGEIAATESLVHYLKSIFGSDIRAIVPQIAMSAGTMIACSCSEILMGKHSNLGPIDPQISGLPTHGIIDEFEEAIEAIKDDPQTIPLWQVILSKYRPTIIGECKKAIQWSEEMVQNWLSENMLKDTADPVTAAKKILSELASHKKTLDHGRHLHADFLIKLGLNIKMIEDDQKLQDKILSVHHSSIITISSTNSYKIIENQEGKAFIQMHR